MKLKEFLGFIADEEIRVELEIDKPFEEDYLYEHFWLSDYRTSDDTAKYYGDYIVESFSLEPDDKNSQITIQIKPS